MIARLLAEMKDEITTNEAKADVSVRETKVEIGTNQERMETKIEVNNEKFEALRGTLLSRMGIHHAMTGASQEEMKVWRKETTACQEATRPV
jgi:hypothetical protein